MKGIVIQIVLFLVCIAAFVFILSSPKTLPKEILIQNQQKEDKSNIESQIQEIKNEMKKDQIIVINDLEDKYNKAQGNEKVMWLDSIINFWDRAMRPAVAAVYLKDKADLTGKTDDRMIAGNKFLFITEFLKPEDKEWAYDEAKTAFQLVLEKEPTNADAQINLGICIVETQPDNPMEGIGLIKEVVEKDSTNVRALLQLGFFSVTSGQFPNAIKRFEQVLAVDPNVSEAYFYLGDTYAQMGEFDKAKANFEKYKTFLPNETAKKEIDNYLEDIKKKFNTKN